MSSLTAMEVSTGPGRKLQRSAAQVRRLCPKMALTARAFKKVDFPEALDPVRSTSFVKRPLLATGSRSRGWNRPVKSYVFSSQNTGRHHWGRVARKDRTATAMSTAPTASNSDRSCWGWAAMSFWALRYTRRSLRVSSRKYSRHSSQSAPPVTPVPGTRPSRGRKGARAARSSSRWAGRVRALSSFRQVESRERKAPRASRSPWTRRLPR